MLQTNRHVIVHMHVCLFGLTNLRERVTLTNNLTIHTTIQFIQPYNSYNHTIHTTIQFIQPYIHTLLYHTVMYIIMAPSDAANELVCDCTYACLFVQVSQGRVSQGRVTLMYTALLRHGWSQQVVPSLSWIASNYKICTRTVHTTRWGIIINCWRNFAIQ